MNVCIFEDFFISRLAPINYLRHTSEIICGAFSLKEKAERSLGRKINLTLHSRKVLAPYLKEKFSKSKINEFQEEDTLFLNARVLFNEKDLKQILKSIKKEKDIAWTQDKYVAAFYTSAANTLKLSEAILHDKPEYLVSYSDIEWLGLNKTENPDLRFINFSSDIILYNDGELRRDLKALVNNKKRVHISPKCKISKHAVLDASEGDIYIGKDTVIEAFSYIKGPVYIGEHCTIRAGAKLYGPLSIGTNSKISGEVTCSVIHPYANKQHHGFLGHSYVCEWVNLGAGSTTSNLKNNYSQITIEVGGEKVDTGSVFLGSIIGDHTKTGINTMLNTGSQIGISSNIFGSGYHDKFIKSFSWEESGAKDFTLYNIEKALNTAKVSMKRRNVEMSEEYEKLLRKIYEERESILI
jgi:UDP-N-acetylglucosamine diphosphorylase/glucosamine-1-phosphate N-acetyltransferase